MENEELLDSNLTTSELVINSTAKEYLRQSAKWGGFLAVMSIIFSVLIMVMGLVFGSLMRLAMSLSPVSDMGPSMTSPTSLYMMMGGFYVFLGLIMLYPGIRLFQFSSRTKMAVRTNDTAAMEDGMKRLRSVFRFYGIITIMMLIVYVLAIIGMIVAKSAFKNM